MALTGTGAQCGARDVVTQIRDDGDIISVEREDNGIALTTNNSPLHVCDTTNTGLEILRHHK